MIALDTIERRLSELGTRAEQVEYLFAELQRVVDAHGLQDEPILGLTRTQARLFRFLAARYGDVASNERLMVRAFPEGTTLPNLSSHLKRLNAELMGTIRIKSNYSFGRVMRADVQRINEVVNGEKSMTSLTPFVSEFLGQFPKGETISEESIVKAIRSYGSPRINHQVSDGEAIAQQLWHFASDQGGSGVVRIEADAAKHSLRVVPLMPAPGYGGDRS